MSQIHKATGAGPTLAPQDAGINPRSAAKRLDQVTNGLDESSGTALANGERQHTGSIAVGTSDRKPSTAQASRNSQAGFVQKLFQMLEDKDNAKGDSIYWSEAGDSFIVNPGPAFQNMLSDYFKHKNPQSFVRQLNMYGFHKVNDVFQGTGDNNHHWEFKHGEGNFRRGERTMMREVRRRPSKHTLDKREIQSKQAPAPYHPPQTENGAMSTSVPETVESRLNKLEHYYLEQHAMLKQSEDMRNDMAVKFEVLSAQVSKSQKTNYEITNALLTILPDQQHPVHRTMALLKQDIEEQMQTVQQLDTMQMDSDRRQSTASSSWGGSGAMSPYQSMQDDSRRPSRARKTPLRGLPSRSAAASPGRQPSINAYGSATNMAAFNSSFYHNTPPVPSWNNSQQHTTSDSSSPSINPLRRHTCADIREMPGYRSDFTQSEHLPLPSLNPGTQYSSFGQSINTNQWSPPRRPSQGENQLRETLGRYQIDSRNPSTASDATVTQSSYPDPPRIQHDTTQASAGSLQPAQTNFFGNVSEGSLFGQQPVGRSLFNQNVFSNSGSSTRRSSMAHILNPADTAEREEEEDVAPDERKRKRLD